MAITLTCTGCGKSYQLKNEMAGRKVRCPGCQSVQVVPEDSTEDYDLESPPGEGGTEGRPNAAFNHDKFLLRQKLMTIGSKYVVWDERQQPILFIERPLYFWRNLLAAFAAAICFLVLAPLSVVVGLGIGQVLHQDVVGVVVTIVFLIAAIALTFAVGIILSPKRHIDFYADESRTDLLLKVLQDKKFHVIVATYTVLTPAGELLGRMRKNYLYNIFRKKWDVFGAGGEKIAVAREDSLILSLLRRFLGPFFGILAHQFRHLDAGRGRAGTSPGRVQPKIHPLRPLRPGREPRPAQNDRPAAGRRPRSIARHG